MTASLVRERESRDDLTARGGVGPGGPSGGRPAPGPTSQVGIPPGRLCVERVPLLASHQGSPPDLVLTWGAMPSVATVDVVVHLHGHSARGRRMNLVRDME